MHRRAPGRRSWLFRSARTSARLRRDRTSDRRRPDSCARLPASLPPPAPGSQRLLVSIAPPLFPAGGCRSTAAGSGTASSQAGDRCRASSQEESWPTRKRPGCSRKAGVISSSGSLQAGHYLTASRQILQPQMNTHEHAGAIRRSASHQAHDSMNATTSFFSDRRRRPERARELSRG